MFLFWLLLPASSVRADVIPGSTELLLFGGTQYDGAQFSVLGVQLLPKLGLEESSFVVGLSLAHIVSRHIGIALDMGYDPRLGEPLEAAVTTATVDLVFHVNPENNGVLYLAAGAGVAAFDSVDGSVDNDVTAVGSAAIGVKIYIGDRFLLRVDFRYIVAPSPFTDQNMMRRTTLGLGMHFH